MDYSIPQIDKFVPPPTSCNFPFPQIELPPVPELPPGFVLSRIDYPPIGTGGCLPVDEDILEELERADERKTNCFEVTLDSGFEITSHLRSVTYRYQPKEITFALKHHRNTVADAGAIYNWITALTKGRENVVVTTVDRFGAPIYENEFIACQIKAHSCPMTDMKEEMVTHNITVSYEHVNFRYFKNPDE